jgi:hypothetical protein
MQRCFMSGRPKRPCETPVEEFDFSDNEFKVSKKSKGPPFWTCVAVAIRRDIVAVRNSNDPEKKTALFTPEEWDVFIDAVKNGEFDLS